MCFPTNFRESCATLHVYRETLNRHMYVCSPVVSSLGSSTVGREFASRQLFFVNSVLGTIPRHYTGRNIWSISLYATSSTSS
jgi:hypothetical protein